jgi:hypothetical protein
MRNAILVAVVVLAACHRPSLGPHSLVAGVKKLGNQAAAVVGKVDVKIAISDTAKQQIRQAAAQRVATIEPITIGNSHGGAARAQTVYARFEGAGGKWLCEPNADANACAQSCNKRFELAASMGAGTSCSCTTEKRCDEMIAH